MYNEANRAGFNELAKKLHVPILHYIMNSELRDWTINPSENFEELTKQALEDDTLANEIENLDNKSIGLNYFACRLSISDLTLFDRIVELLENKQKQRGIAFGQKLAQIVIDNNPRSPVAVIESFVDCLNTFFEGSFHFKQHSWTSRQKGKHTQRMAPIEIEPLR